MHKQFAERDNQIEQMKGSAEIDSTHYPDGIHVSWSNLIQPKHFALEYVLGYYYEVHPKSKIGMGCSKQ